MNKVTEGCIWGVIGIYGAVFIGCVCVAVSMLTPVHAGERSDYINSLEPSEYCEVIADQFYAGVLGKLYGSAREFKHSTPEVLENMEHGIPLPKDGLYVFEWDKLDAAEKAFVRQHVLAGYDKATPDLTDQDALAMGQAYFDACMEARKSLKHTGFIRVEALENINPAKRYSQCAELLYDYAFIGKAIKHGRDCDDMKKVARETDGVSDERRAKILRILNEACAAPDIEAWFEGYYKACMGLK